MNILLTLFMMNALLQVPQDSLIYKSLDTEAFAYLIENKECLIIDVRTLEEYTTSRIPGAEFAPSKESLKKIVRPFAKDYPILLYCTEGYRSLSAAQILVDWGYLNITNLNGGFQNWQKLAFPIDEIVLEMK